MKNNTPNQPNNSIEDKHKALLKVLPDIFFRIDKNMDFIDCHVHDESVLMLPPNKIIGANGKDILPEPLYEQTKGYLYEALETKDIQIYDYSLLIDGNEEWFDTRMVPSDEDEVVVIIRNITEKKKAETLLKNANEDLQESIEKIKEINAELEEAKEKAELEERKLDTLISNLTGMVYRCKNDRDWTMEFVSEGALELTGYCTNEIVNNKVRWAEIIKPEYREMVWGEIQNAISKHERFILNYEINCKDGEVKWLQEQGQGIFTNNKLEAIEGFITDITKLKEIEKELIISKEKAEESDRLKSAFLANMSHEIRTPMNGIIGFSEMITKDNISDEKRKFFSKTVVESSKQLLKIVNDILDISRIEIGSLKLYTDEVIINDLMMSLYAVFNRQAQDKLINLRIHKALNDKLSTINTDKTRLQQILNNLISNALKFTPKGYVEFGYNLQEDKLHFYVKDSGIGIAKKQQKNIFESFRQEDVGFSRKYDGAGLGLSISKRLVEMLNGKIWVESEKGKGSVFNFTIPYNPVHKDSLQTSDYNKNYPTVLVAEDEDVNYFYIYEIVSKLDVNIIRAKDGLETVEACSSNPNIDLVLMDIKMPNLNGYEATQKIKAFKPNLPIIAQTAYAMAEDKNVALNAGCDDYISKPIDPTELSNMVQNYLKVGDNN